MNLYMIQQEYVEAFSQIEVDPETGEVLNLEALAEVQAKFEEKSEATALFIKNELALAEAIKSEEAMLRERRKGVEARAKWLKEYLSNCLDGAGRDRLDTPKCTISFRSSKAVQILVGFFKGLVTCIESSNNFSWDFDEKNLEGKLFGGIFGREQYIGTDGKPHWSTKCLQIRSTDSIRKGDFEIPEDKPAGSPAVNGFQELPSDDDLPF